MERALRMVVGLGNPGPSYKGTRHNVARDFIDRIAQNEGLSFKKKGQAEIIRLALSSAGDVAFARLDCFMNLSGPALQSLLSKEGVAIHQTVIVTDDFMIPFGALRLRPGGSAGGHNGLKSIIETFGTQEFPRLRVGVGPVPEGLDPADFVLGRFTAAERTRMDDLHAAISAALTTLFSDGIERAMTSANKIHL